MEVAGCMKCSLGISNFLEEISSLSHSIVSLYFLRNSLESPTRLGLAFTGSIERAIGHPQSFSLTEAVGLFNYLFKWDSGILVNGKKNL